MSENDEKKFDFLGDELSDGDIVIVADGIIGQLKICKILYFTNKMVKVKPLKEKKSFLRYSHQLIKMENDKATEYILSNT